MSAGKRDLYIEKGATKRMVLTLQNDDETAINLTGYSARMQVRKRARDEDVLADWSSKLTLGGALGTITFLLTDAETAAIAFKQGVYDLEIESGGGETTRLLEGAVTVSEEVTR